jgi:hypothetical protein
MLDQPIKHPLWHVPLLSQINNGMLDMIQDTQSRFASMEAKSKLFAKMSAYLAAECSTVTVEDVAYAGLALRDLPRPRSAPSLRHAARSPVSQSWRLCSHLHNRDRIIPKLGRRKEIRQTLQSQPCGPTMTRGSTQR